MFDGMKLSPESILKKFSSNSSISKLVRMDISTSQLSDALNHVTGNSGVIQGVKPLLDKVVIGRVVTASTSSDDWGTSLKAIDAAKSGEILFIYVEDDNNAIWGELTSKTAQKKGIVGTVIYGAVRDVGAVKRLGYPVFSKKIVPNAGSPKNEGKVNISIKCGDITVNPQDIIVGDECGVIVIPNEHLDAVIKETLNIKKKEDQIISKIEKGRSLSDILGIK
ncbi:MAG: RraA family protein [Methanobacterium sp.]|uniref:RraA family protein n=1 Tax=Methanobacterium sp. TaxID=2164 RepID=UPI003D648EC4|nr:RraA family protein [Methanobacterium sp.]